MTADRPVLRRAARAAFLVLFLLALIPAASSAEACFPSATALCLNGGRFRVEVAWTIPGGASGVGQAVPLSEDTGLFWFFNNSNLELAVKVLDGRAVNRHFWVFYGSLSNVEYTMTVTDTLTRSREVYFNPAGRMASQADTSAFEPEPLSAVRSAASGAVDATSFAAPPLRLGPEFQVNVTTPRLQWDPFVAVGSDGGFMVVWTDEGSVRGRVYDPAGAPRSGELSLSSGPPSGSQWRARVAANGTGRYLAVWIDGDRLAAQAFGLAGQRIGEMMALSSGAYRANSASVVADSLGGGFLVAWNEGGGGAGSSRVRRFSASGQPAEAAVVLGPPRAELGLAASSSGGFLVTWIEDVGQFFETDLWAQRLTESGAPLAPFRVNGDVSRLPGYHHQPLPIFHRDGGLSILWETSTFCCDRPGAPGLFAQRYDAEGRRQGAIVTLRQGPSSFSSQAAAAVLPSGDALVLLDAWGPEDPDGGVFGQLFDPAWSPRGRRFRINTYTDLAQTYPAVALGAGGDLVAVWSSGVDDLPILPPAGWGEGTQDGSFFGVFGQRFTLASCALNPDQVCLGNRFRVEVELTNPWSGKPEAAHAVPLTSDTGAFWFFGENNVELIVKALDGRPVNGHFWVFYGALSDVAYKITVTDTQTGRQRIYRNRRGQLASKADVAAFPE